MEGERLLLSDLGGTHVRFAISYDGVIERIRKYRVSDFANPVQATERYLNDEQRGMHDFNAYLMSSAAVRLPEGAWHFSNINSWVFYDSDMVANIATDRFVMVDDFAANAYGIINIDKQALRPIHTCKKDKAAPCVIAGCGTGLGLSYLLPDGDGYQVHETWGGHMVPACITAEQFEVMQAVQEFKMLDSSPIFEDVVSGPGLTRIYHALKGTQPGKDPYSEGKELLYRLSQGDDAAEQALRLFHQFLGLFLHQAVVYMHAYGGVYLTGGMIDAIFREDRFLSTFMMEYFMMSPVPVVANTLNNTPIHWVRDEYIALQGLVNAWQGGHLHT